MAKATLDTLGFTYIGLASSWTVILACGIAFLWQERRLPCLQIRRIPLVIAAICCLHAYWFLCTIAYVIGPLAPCTAEFWLMTIYLPCGIALLQAANSQFLHIATLQRKFRHLSNLDDDLQNGTVRGENAGWTGFVNRVKKTDRIVKLMCCIAIGGIVQVALSLFIFFGSKKFHPSYGLWEWNPVGSIQQKRMQCSKGWEWWLSIVWQFFWAWIYAPYMLWKARNVRDAHGWRTQTILCCLAGLPATPLWLAGLYIPQMAKINAYFPPPLWFSVFIFFIEIFTIFLPVYQVLKTHTLRQETINAIKLWEEKNNKGNSEGSFSTGEQSNGSQTSLYGKWAARSINSKKSKSPSIDSQRSAMYTMAALENSLRLNAEPLLEFAALRDFSGENVSFLTHVAQWKQEWTIGASKGDKNLKQRQFIRAARIYSAFVSIEFSEFPINLSSKTFKQLEDAFQSSAAALNRNRVVASANAATPFDFPEPPSPAPSSAKSEASSPTDDKPFESQEMNLLGAANLRSVARLNHLSAKQEEEKSLPPDFVLPIAVLDLFDKEVFGAAEKEIKHLVLTNTWPKFVNAGFADQGLEGKSTFFDKVRMLFGKVQTV